jgi:hypothetical protein
VPSRGIAVEVFIGLDNYFEIVGFHRHLGSTRP